MDIERTPLLVIGCGSIGKRHIRNLLEIGAKKLLAFDPQEDRRREIESETGIATSDDLEAAFETCPTATFICSPTRFHLAHALRAARAGCHLFIEKPIAEEPEGIEPLIEEIESRRLRSLVGCNFRFHPGLRRARALLDEGDIGKIISARAQFGHYLPEWHPWEDYRKGYSARRSLGGGVTLDRIHEIDLIRWLVGEVTTVYAMIGHLTSLEIDTEDVAEIMLRFENGAFGSVHLDYARRSYDCRMEIVGEEGTILWRYQDHSIRWHTAKDQEWHEIRWPRYDGNQMYLDECRHFIRVMEGSEPSALDAKEALRVLSIASAAKKSSDIHAEVRL